LALVAKPPEEKSSSENRQATLTQEPKYSTSQHQKLPTIVEHTSAKYRTSKHQDDLESVRIFSQTA
jgi:hypothetical protein